MTLQNLLSIGRLKPHVPDKGEVNRLLAAIERNLADAEAGNVSDDTRFDAAYERQRNASDYSGHPIGQAALRECLKQAKGLESLLSARLTERHPEWLRPDDGF